jgi:sec-independent protein translocase protein TatC
MSSQQATTASKGDAKERGGQGGTVDGAVDDDTPMTFWEHLDELRKRLMWSILAFFIACAVAWEFHEKLQYLITIPFLRAWKEQNLPGTPGLHFGAPATPFNVYFKLSMIGGALLSSPFIFYQLWSFVAPGLYAKEKKYVIPFVLFSTLLFVGGGLFGWRTALPIAFGYFLSLAGAIGSGEITITPTVMMGDYLDFVLQILLGFGLIFELPLLLLFLSIAGVVNYLQLIRFGRWFVLVAFVVAAVLTPPDVTSQAVMAVPMCLLYVVSIGLTYLFGQKPTEAQRAAYKREREQERAERS